MENNEIKKNFIKLLLSTKRNGIENVIEWLEKTDFYQAPASTMFHGNNEGGLLEHSMNVAHMAIKIKDMLDNISDKQQTSDINQRLRSVSRESLLIVGLLHDLCKVNIYKKEQRNRKVNGGWESYDCYGVDYSAMPLGHGEKSVIQLLRLGLELTDDEIIAIRWHMSAWDLAFQSTEAKGNLNAAKNKCLLLSILQSADELATTVLEISKQ